MFLCVVKKINAKLIICLTTLWRFIFVEVKNGLSVHVSVWCKNNPAAVTLIPTVPPLVPGAFLKVPASQRARHWRWLSLKHAPLRHRLQQFLGRVTRLCNSTSARRAASGSFSRRPAHGEHVCVPVQPRARTHTQGD